MANFDFLLVKADHTTWMQAKRYELRCAYNSGCWVHHREGQWHNQKYSTSSIVRMKKLVRIWCIKEEETNRSEKQNKKKKQKKTKKSNKKQKKIQKKTKNKAKKTKKNKKKTKNKTKKNQKK